MSTSFQVGPLLGVGSFGSVYQATLCRPHGLRQAVALKVLRPDLPSPIIRRFRDEARLLALLQHASIVRVFELGSLPDGCWFVAMEHIEGVDLEWASEQLGPLPPALVWHLGVRVACALDYAWTHRPADGEPLRIEHRDIKPPNILITPRGDVRVLDFGLARARFPAREARTEVGGAFGTLPYMSPDRWTGLDDPSNDIFALGTTLAELLSGFHATGDPSFAKQQVWRDRCLDEAERLVGPDAAGLLREMCSPKITLRPPAAEVRERLRALRGPPEAILPWLQSAIPLLVSARTLKQGPLSNRRIRPDSPRVTQPTAELETPPAAPPELTPASPSPERDDPLTPMHTGPARRLATPLAATLGLLAASLVVNVALVMLVAFLALW